MNNQLPALLQIVQLRRTDTHFCTRVTVILSKNKIRTYDVYMSTQYCIVIAGECGSDAVVMQRID